jgi:hypothetical protein
MGKKKGELNLLKKLLVACAERVAEQVVGEVTRVEPQEAMDGGWRQNNSGNTRF